MVSLMGVCLESTKVVVKVISMALNSDDESVVWMVVEMAGL